MKIRWLIIELFGIIKKESNNFHDAWFQMCKKVMQSQRFYEIISRIFVYVSAISRSFNFTWKEKKNIVSTSHSRRCLLLIIFCASPSYIFYTHVFFLLAKCFIINTHFRLLGRRSLCSYWGKNDFKFIMCVLYMLWLLIRYDWLKTDFFHFSFRCLSPSLARSSIARCSHSMWRGRFSFANIRCVMIQFSLKYFIYAFV